MSGLRSLVVCLSVWLAACTEDVSPTVLRFFVYSDVAFTRVRATVGGQEAQLDGGVFRDFYPDAGTSGDNLLFSIAVERTERSTNQQEAELSLTGFVGPSADSQIVLRQTVRAQFTDRQTRVVRIWLSRACVHESGRDCEAGMTCDGTTGGCIATPDVTTTDFNATAGMGRWQPTDDYRACGARDDGGNSDDFCPVYCSPADDSDCMLRAPADPCTDDDQCWSGSCECVDSLCAQLRCCTPPCARGCAADKQNDPLNCGSCGLRCEYPRCSGGTCSATAVVPPAGGEPFTETTDFTGVYMRRVVGGFSSIAAIGVNSPRVGAKLQVFVASDSGGEPGTVLASAEVTVQEAAGYTDGGRPRGAEYVLPQPLVFDSPRAWIGLSATAISTIDVSTTATLIEERSATKLPAVGQSFAPGDVIHPEPALFYRPSFYGVFYP